jgi:hypothetical protein
MNLPNLPFMRKDKKAHTAMRHPSRISSQKVTRKDGLSMPLQLAVEVEEEACGRFVQRQQIRKRSLFGDFM